MSDEEFELTDTWVLRRLRRRGLEIFPTIDVMSHKKYFPFVTGELDHEGPLVTADDDVLYDVRWLEGLQEAHSRWPDDILCYRALRVRTEGGQIAPYLSWGEANSETQGPRNFATGVSGVLYPSRFLPMLRSAGNAFVELAPKADDVWLHLIALRNGVQVRQIVPEPLDFESIRGAESGLFIENVEGGGNDDQIRACYLPSDVALLLVDELEPNPRMRRT